MRILLINPNTTAPITARLVEAARAQAPGVDFRGATGRFGAAYVASQAAYAVAGHAALDAFAREGEGCDAVLIACFGDPGLDAVREIAAVPVLGMAEASILAGSAAGGRVGIVTGGERWPAMLEAFAAARGLSERIAGIRAVAPDGGGIARDPDGAVAALAEAAARCRDEDGADVAILGGAGLIGLRARVGERLGMPVLCSFETALAATLAAARAGAGPSEPAALPPVPTIGLSDALARRLGGL